MFRAKHPSHTNHSSRRGWKSIWIFFTAVAVVALALASGIPGGLSASQPVSAAAYQLIFPYFVKDFYGANSTLYLLNVGTGLANVSVNFSGPGVNLQKLLSLPPGEQAAIHGSDYADLASGSYLVVVTSDQVVTGSIDFLRSNWEQLAAYRPTEYAAGLSGAPDSVGAVVYQNYFGPFFYGDLLGLWNPYSTDATVAVSFMDPNGIEAGTQVMTIAPGGYQNAGTGANLPTTFAGLAVVSSDQPVLGLLSQSSVDNSLFELQDVLGSGATSATLSRVFKHVDEGASARTTQVFVANTGTSTGTVNLSFYSAAGVALYTEVFSLASLGSHIANLASITALTNGIYSVRAVSDQPLVLGELTTFDNQPGTNSAASLPAGPSGMSLFLPHQYLTSEGFSAFSIQNNSTSAANLTITLGGSNSTPLNLNRSVAAYGWTRVDLSQLAGQLGTDFDGTAIIQSTAPVSAYIDEYYFPPIVCHPPANLALVRQPGGDLQVGDTLTITATLDGDAPFIYAWTLDGAPAGENLSTFTHTFLSTGNYTAGLTVTNDCGTTSDSLGVQVLPPAEPPLSSSYKRVNLTSVDSGDILTYTLFLRNSSALAVHATLTDTIPLHTQYLPNSARTSDGSGVTVSNGALAWSGDILPGTPVLIDFAVQLTEALPIGDTVENSAQMVDQYGYPYSLTAQSVFNPGYRLSIDHGLLYTNIPTVTLTYAWNQADNITEVRFSNDGGFGPEGDTTDWLPVNPTAPTYENWTISTLGDLRMLRLVYVKFRDGSGNQYGPFQDDIIYDPQPPEILSVEIIPAARSGFLSSGTDVIVRVTAVDDNTGVGEVQVSSRSDFASYESFPMTGEVTDIPWTIPPGSDVFVRVADRSGNLSTAVREPGAGHELMLPLVIKLQPGG